MKTFTKQSFLLFHTAPALRLLGCWMTLLIIVVCSFGCQPLPKVQLRQFTFEREYKVEKDSLFIFLPNPLACPLRLSASSKQLAIQKVLDQHFPFILPANADTSFQGALIDWTEGEAVISFRYVFGDPADTIISDTIALPFPKGKTYEIIQGYKGSFSHNSDYSRYAIDFNLQIGDTICAAADGSVVGVIEGYTYGGNSKRWRPYANFITLYHPQLGLFTQYVHLDHLGSFVAVGDAVQQGQAIGLSGETGFTSVEHLHFNVLKNTESSLSSTPVYFGKEGYPGEKMKRKMNITH
ncbi:MAG: M23 family metallopeptidase [Bacteroidota bacterium]